MRRHSSPHSAGGFQQRGYALLLMLVLLTMGILFTVVSQLSLVGMKWARTGGGNVVLQQAKEALIGYAATYRDTHSGDVFGYLPCPDMKGDGSADALSADCGGTDGKAVIGLLPYKQLGLASNQDADGNCLWYAVSGTFKASGSPGLPMPMNWDTQGQIEVRDANNNIITTPNDANGGAAAVIFSVGPPLSSQSRLAGTSSTPCGVSTLAVASSVYANYIDVDPLGVDLAKSQPFPGAANSAVRVTQGITGNSVNNDQILAITPKEILARIKQRSDHAGLLNTLMTEIGTALEGKVTSDLAISTAPVIALPTIEGAAPTAYAGHVGTLPTLSVASNDTKLLGNWNEQYRYVVCTNLCGYCLSVGIVGVGAGVQQCNGALLFGGEHSTGGPRPSHPLQLTDLFEKDGATTGDNKGALSIVNGNINPIDNTNSFTGNSAYTGGSTDVGICVAPSSRKPVSFSCDISAFTKQATHTGTAIQEAYIDTSAATVTLGNASATSGLAGDAGNGCVWFPTALPFHTVLRAYFSFNIVDPGEGFVFALADAARNPSPVCGSTTTANRLGYDGNTYPKFGLEIDTRPSTATNDPPSPFNHYSFIYWGTTAISTDDNKHGAGVLGSHTEPLNPTSSLSSSSCVQSASWSPTVPKVVTVTTAAAHGLVSGQQVTIYGITPNAYNGSYSITVVDATHFTYPLASGPGASGSGGSVSSANIGLSILTTCDAHLPYATWPNSIPPNNVPIYVRLDIAKSYTAPTGTYTFKAYIATDFPTCSLADFQNTSSNLSDLCTTLRPSIEQDGIAIDDISGFGEALANIYAGFTSGQKATVASNESVVIKNFIIHSQ